MSKLTAAILAALLLSAAPPAFSQADEADLAPERGKFEVQPAAAPDKPYLVPDVPRTLAELTSVNTSWFTFRMGLITLLDYTAFKQDAASIGQVGAQDDQWQVRAARVVARGTLGETYKASYLVGAEYEGTQPGTDKRWSSTDISLTFPLGNPATKLTVGKTKETFSYEMVGDSANLPQQERVLSPFFVSRNVGAKLISVLGEDHRMTLAAGVFNKGWLNDGAAPGTGTHVTARFTGLAWDEADGKRFLHLGVAGRHVGADNGTLRYRGRPESDVADYYVDTGNMVAEHARHLGLEALWNDGPFSVLTEYHRAWVSSPALANPEFSGYYVTGSWILTGETRPYDRTVGYARRVMPATSRGATELVARYSRVNLDDTMVSGGKFDKTYVGLNWWATQRWKFGIGWGRTWLDRLGTTGVTDSVLARAQLIL